MGYYKAERKSLAASIEPRAAELRRKDIMSSPHLPRRMGALAAHKRVMRNPAVAAQRHNLSLKARDDLKYVGTGTTSSVFVDSRRQDDRVIKIDRTSMYFTPASRQLKVDRINTYNRVAAMTLGNFLTDQRSAVSDHPFFAEAKAILAWQPKIEGPGVHFGHKGNVEQAANYIDGMERSYPGFVDSLAEFRERSLRLGKEDELLPDVFCPNNVLYDTKNGQLKLVDEGLIDKRFPDMQHGILLKFNVIGQALGQPAQAI